VCQFLDCFHEFHVFVIHQEADRGAVRTATKTMVELLHLTDGERRGIFIVERTAGLVLPAGLFEWHARVDDLDDVGAGQQFIDKCLGNASGHAA
jgi:hypothetical protein